jgi:hypothetical protein
MMAGHDSYFLNKPVDYSELSAFDIPNYPQRPYYYRLLQHQDLIGCDHFLRGKLS